MRRSTRNDRANGLTSIGDSSAQVPRERTGVLAPRPHATHAIGHAIALTNAISACLTRSGDAKIAASAAGVRAWRSERSSGICCDDTGLRPG
jgi:hypothetical protein